MNTVEWRPVVGYEGLYEVSDQGDIRSWRTWRGVPGPRLLTGTPNGTGHLVVSMHNHGMRTRSVHRMVTAAFLGPCPPGMEVRHLDGNPANNVLTNLRYGTKSENQRDSIRHGTQYQARKTHCIHGHAYDAANTLPRKAGGRLCRQCHRIWDTARRARARAARFAEQVAS